MVTGVVTGGSLVGAEVEDSQQRGKRDDSWDYADEFFAQGRNRTLGGPGTGNRTIRENSGRTAFASQSGQEDNRTKPGQAAAKEPRKAVSIPMPGQ